jgi:putative membrane protein
VRPDQLWQTWNTDPPIVFGLLVLAWLYGRGTLALWRLAGRGRGVRPWQVVTFGAGLLALAVALVSPLDALSEQLFWAHMVQHLLLIAVAAPLIVLGGPLLPLLWAWPRPVRLAMGRARTRARPLLGLAHVASHLPVAFGLHSLALWVWHTPRLYEGALHNGPLHATEHLVLLGTGLLFWWAACGGLARAGRGPGAGVLYVFGLAAQCTGLGALIAIASRPWYPVYAATAPAWGLSVMDDQVIAGSIMWVPAGLVYLAYALVLLGAWLRPLPRSAEQH